MEADRLEVLRPGAEVRASGNVDVQWDGSRLRCSELMLRQQDHRVEASGGIDYRSDDLHATADRATLDVEQETGVLERVDLRLSGEAGRLGGTRLEKLPGRRLLLDDGYFTTCEAVEGRAPDWELRGSHLDVRLDDYARMRGASLAVRGAPLLYLPYLIFPTKQTRQSGLLPFSFGTSTNRGIMFSQPGFVAIDKHQDLTLTGVVETSARLGVDGVYRYTPSRKRWGELHAAFYNEAVRGEAKPGTPAVGVPDNRGTVELLHRELGEGWTGYADVQWVGDERYLREIQALEGDLPERELRRSRRYTTSRVGFLDSSGFRSAGMESSAWQELTGVVVDDGDPSTTNDPVYRDPLHKPLDAWWKTDRSVGPLAVAVDAALSSFVRDKGVGGERLDAASTVGLPLLVRGPVQSRAWAKGRGSLYVLNERDVLDNQQAFVERLGSAPSRGVFEAGLDTRTKFARDFTLSPDASWAGLRHSLEPFAALRYANRSSWDDIPLFDRLDAIDGRDVASYGVDSRFFLRRRPEDKASAFELGRVSLGQSFNFTRRVVDDHFSDMDLSAFVQPMQGLALRTLASYNVGAQQLRGANASLSWEAGPLAHVLRGNGSHVAAAYRYVRSDTADDVLQSTELLARLAFTRNVALGMKGLYDIVSREFVEKAVGVTFSSSCDCWSVGIGVVDRVNPAATANYGTAGGNAPHETQVRLAFELAGLGGFGSSINQRTSPALDSVEYEDVGFWRAGW